MCTVGPAEGIARFALQFCFDGFQIAGWHDDVRVEDEQVFAPGTLGGIVARLSRPGVGLGVVVQVETAGIAFGHFAAGQGRTVVHHDDLEVAERMRRQALGLQSPASTAVVGRQALTAIIVLGAIWLLNDYRGVPTPVLLLTLLLLGGMFMATRTAFGRRIYAIGGNLEAARLSGINVERTKLAVFAINGLMVAIAGLILSSRLGAGSPSAGNIAELDAIAACVIGGTSLAGGVGSVAGAVMGAFIMASLDNGMSMMDVPTFWQYIVKGAILLLAVWMDSATKRRS